MSDVETFIQYFRELLETTINHEGDKWGFRVATTSFIILDTLAKAVYGDTGDHKQNRKRFEKLILQFSAWEDKERVSLPHIVRLLELCPSHFSTQMLETSHKLFSAWGYEPFKSIKNDPLYSELESFWPSCKLPKPFPNRNLKDFRHLSLLYYCRCDLVHELKFHGEGHKPEYGKPYYYKTHTESTFYSKAYYKLFYPPSFLYNITMDCLGQLGIYFVQNGIDPYGSFDYGFFLFPELNG